MAWNEVWVAQADKLTSVGRQTGLRAYPIRLRGILRPQRHDCVYRLNPPEQSGAEWLPCDQAVIVPNRLPLAYQILVKGFYCRAVSSSRNRISSQVAGKRLRGNSRWL